MWHKVLPCRLPIRFRRVPVRSRLKVVTSFKVESSLLGVGCLGTWNKEQGTRNKEQGTRNKEQGTRNKEQGTRNKERWFHVLEVVLAAKWPIFTGFG